MHSNAGQKGVCGHQLQFFPSFSKPFFKNIYLFSHAKNLIFNVLFEWRMASGTWFGETSRQSQAEPVKQQHTRISPNHLPETKP